MAVACRSFFIRKKKGENALLCQFGRVIYPPNVG